MSNPELKSIDFQGQTDDVGGTAANQTLSQKRADAVKAWLIDAGVDGSILTSKGYGESQPAAPIEGKSGKDLKDARYKNRRVQFKITR